MATAVKILLTATFSIMILKAWLNTVAFATATLLAGQSGKLSQTQKDRADHRTGVATLKALGLTLWVSALGTLVWVWL